MNLWYVEVCRWVVVFILCTCPCSILKLSKSRKLAVKCLCL